MNRPQAQDRAIGEAVDRLAPAVAQVLAAGEGLAPGLAPHELLGEHALGAQLADHLGDVDEGVPAVDVGELRLVGGLEPVVELLGDARAPISRAAPRRSKLDFLGDRPKINPRKAASSSLFFRSAPIASRRPRVLDLDGDRAAVVQPGGVDLTDRGGGQRLPVELGEHALGPPAELALEHHARELARHRRRVVAQSRERCLVDRLELRRYRGGGRDERQYLPRLHQRSLGAAEQLRVALRRADVELGALRIRQPAAQPYHGSLAGGARAQRRQWGGATQPPATDPVADRRRVAWVWGKTDIVAHRASTSLFMPS